MEQNWWSEKLQGSFLQLDLIRQPRERKIVDFAKIVAPLPTHLRSVLHPSGAASGDELLVAELRCACGGELFELKYPGQTHERDGDAYPCIAGIGGRFLFIIRACCLTCNVDHLLIDQDLHGWDGVVCHDAKQAALPRPALVTWECKQCHGAVHKAQISIRSEGKEFFVEECGGRYDERKWVDAFGWFGMNIECSQCGKKSEEWVSLETM